MDVRACELEDGLASPACNVIWGRLLRLGLGKQPYLQLNGQLMLPTFDVLLMMHFR
jgi:hypothetical protein